MSALPPESSAPEAGDPLGIRYPSTSRIWNYHLRGKDNFEPDRQAAEAGSASRISPDGGLVFG